MPHEKCTLHNNKFAYYAGIMLDAFVYYYAHGIIGLSLLTIQMIDKVTCYDVNCFITTLWISISEFCSKFMY